MLYIDDITKLSTEKTTINLFADDAKVFSSDSKDLQNVLDQVCLFFKARQVSLAHEKCQKLTIGKTAVPSHFILENTFPIEVAVDKDLGIHISANMKWENHINKIKKQAFQRCYQILKSFQSKNIWTLVKAFTTFIRPILEYATTIWNPYMKKDKISIERVQRFYTRKICNRCNIQYSSYSDRLYKLNLKSLEHRRMEFDIIMVYKVVHNLVYLPQNEFFEFYNSPYNTRRHEFCLKQKSFKSTIQHNFFKNRIVPIWNQLPSEIVSTQTLENFKNKIKHFDFSSITQLMF